MSAWTGHEKAGANFVNKDDGNDSALRSLFRTLWAKHASQMREVIIASMDKLQSGNAAFEDLMNNQAEIGGSFDAAAGVNKDGARLGKALTKALQDHVVAAGAVLAALKRTDLPVRAYIEAMGSDDRVRLRFPRSSRNPVEVLLSAVTDFYDNGSAMVEIIVFAFPGLSGNKRRLVTTAVYQHLYNTIMQAVLYHKKDFKNSLKWAHGTSTHLMVVSDVLTNALINELGGKRIGLRLRDPLLRTEKFLSEMGSFYTPTLSDLLV